MILAVETMAQFERLTSDAQGMTDDRLNEMVSIADRKRGNGRFASRLGYHILLHE